MHIYLSLFKNVSSIILVPYSEIRCFMNAWFLLKIIFHVTVNLKISLEKVLTDVVCSFISNENCNFIHNQKKKVIKGKPEKTNHNCPNFTEFFSFQQSVSKRWSKLLLNASVPEVSHLAYHWRSHIWTKHLRIALRDVDVDWTQV